MSDDALAPSALAPWERLSPFHRAALFQGARLAVLTVNTATSISLSQPAKTPSESVVWREALGAEVCSGLKRLWDSLEEADLRGAGEYLFHGILRQMIDQSQAGVDYLKQFSSQPPPPKGPEPPSPAPGSSA